MLKINSHWLSGVRIYETDTQWCYQSGLLVFSRNTSSQGVGFPMACPMPPGFEHLQMETESGEQEKEKGLCMSWVSAVKLLFQLIKLHDRMIRHF